MEEIKKRIKNLVDQYAYANAKLHLGHSNPTGVFPDLMSKIMAECDLLCQKSSTIPILNKHDHTQVIGHATFGIGDLTIELKEPMDQDLFEEIFGFCGYRLDEAVMDPETKTISVKKAVIVEWSNPQTPAQGTRDLWHLILAYADRRVDCASRPIHGEDRARKALEKAETTLRAVIFKGQR